MRTTVGDDFQKETKYTRNQNIGNKLDWMKKPETYKKCSHDKTIKLPNQLKDTSSVFAEVLIKRRSIREFSIQPLSKIDLAFLLWASTGIQRQENGYQFRVAPSAGALYPIETYIVANNVEEVAEGIYHYNIKDHSLEEIKSGNFGNTLAHAALNQRMCEFAPVVFIWTAIFSRSKWKYAQ
jgi:hypothetical protein